MIGVIRSVGWWRFACGDVFFIILFCVLVSFVFLYFSFYIFVFVIAAPVLSLLLLVGGKGFGSRKGFTVPNQGRVYCLLLNFFCHCSPHLVTHIWCAAVTFQLQLHIWRKAQWQIYTSGPPRTVHEKFQLACFVTKFAANVKSHIPARQT